MYTTYHLASLLSIPGTDLHGDSEPVAACSYCGTVFPTGKLRPKRVYELPNTSTTIKELQAFGISWTRA